MMTTSYTQTMLKAVFGLRWPEPRSQRERTAFAIARVFSIMLPLWLMYYAIGRRVESFLWFVAWSIAAGVLVCVALGLGWTVWVRYGRPGAENEND